MGSFRARIAAQNCPEPCIEGQDFTLKHLTDIRYRPPRGDAWAWARQLCSWGGRHRLTAFSARGSEPSLAGVSGQHIAGSSTKVKEICSWPSEPEKAVFICSDAFLGSVLWLRRRQADKDARCMSMRTLEEGSGGGSVPPHSMRGRGAGSVQRAAAEALLQSPEALCWRGMGSSYNGAESRNLVLSDTCLVLIKNGVTGRL